MLEIMLQCMADVGCREGLERACGALKDAAAAVQSTRNEVASELQRLDERLTELEGAYRRALDLFDRVEREAHATAADGPPLPENRAGGRLDCQGARLTE